MKPLHAAFSIAVSMLLGVAHADQHLVPAQSEIVFTSRQMGVPVDGRFRRFDAQVAFDPTQPESARIALGIDMSSVVLGAAEVEAELAKPEWFGVKEHPRATFQSTSVKPLGASRFEVAGKLAIKGATRDVVVPVTLAQAGANTTASGAFVIKRLDFKIGEGEWADPDTVANEVTVRVRMVLPPVK
jgi:polyisoprenoid-binding protein YceI